MIRMAIMSRRSVAAAAVAVAVAILLVVLVIEGSGNNSLSEGPLHDDHAGAATGVTLWSTGRTWTAVVEGTFEGTSAARVTDLKMLRVPGFPTPKLRSTGYITTGGIGSGYGLPDRDFGHERILGSTIHPSDNRTPHLAGVMLVLQADRKPGMYAIEGVQLDYSVGSKKYQSRLYTAVTGCVPPPHKERCPVAVLDKVTDRMLADSGE